MYSLFNCVIPVCTCWLYGMHFGDDGPRILAEEDGKMPFDFVQDQAKLTHLLLF